MAASCSCVNEKALCLSLSKSNLNCQIENLSGAKSPRQTDLKKSPRLSVCSSKRCQKAKNRRFNFLLQCLTIGFSQGNHNILTVPVKKVGSTWALSVILGIYLIWSGVVSLSPKISCVLSFFHHNLKSNIRFGLSVIRDGKQLERGWGPEATGAFSFLGATQRRGNNLCHDKNDTRKGSV